MKKLFTIILLMVATLTISFAQDSTKVNGYMGVDLLNKFVWRGIDMHNGPSIQPIVGVTFCGFDLGAVGAFSVNDQNYQEVDLYVTYTYNFVTLGVTDYFVGNNDAWNDPVLGAYNPQFFDFSDSTTAHIIEGTIKLGNDKFPLSASLSYNLYGIDKDNSMYTEVNYAYKNMTYFVGAAFDKGLYKTDDGFGIVNVGATFTKDIVVNDKFSVPIKASLITNPASEKIYLVFGFSF